MHQSTRKWFLSAVLRAALIGVGVAAIAGGLAPVLSATVAEESPSDPSVTPTESPSATPSPEPAPSVTPEPTESPEPEEESESPDDEDGDGDTHGACVSYWAHAAKAAGLHGKLKGKFVSMVAHSDCRGESPDRFTAELQAALDAQAAAGEREKKHKEKKHKEKHRKHHGKKSKH